MLFNRTPRTMFGYPYEQVLDSHRANVRELATLRADLDAGDPLLTDKPDGWSWREWGDYMDDTADELRTLRERRDGIAG